jgi:hypothetical protein
LTKWLVYSDSGFPASRHTLQNGVAAEAAAEVLRVTLAVFLDDDIVSIRLIVSDRSSVDGSFEEKHFNFFSNA